jgi:hypothetical protein
MRTVALVMLIYGLHGHDSKEGGRQLRGKGSRRESLQCRIFASACMHRVSGPCDACKDVRARLEREPKKCARLLRAAMVDNSGSSVLAASQS